MGSCKGIDDFGGASCQDLDIGIGGKRSLDTIENNLRFLVSAHIEGYTAKYPERMPQK